METLGHHRCLCKDDSANKRKCDHFSSILYQRERGFICLLILHWHNGMSLCLCHLLLSHNQCTKMYWQRKLGFSHTLLSEQCWDHFICKKSYLLIQCRNLLCFASSNGFKFLLLGSIEQLCYLNVNILRCHKSKISGFVFCFLFFMLALYLDKRFD